MILIISDDDRPTRAVHAPVDVGAGEMSRWIFSQVIAYANDHKTLPGLVEWHLVEEE